LKGVIDRALKGTRTAWPSIRSAFAWVHRVAELLGRTDLKGRAIRRRWSGLLGAMTRHRNAVGKLGPAIDHFAKVSRSYRPGLFACYDTPDLPRTNNALEQTFGSHRYHERRATGRKGASPALVLRGSAKLVAGLATRRGTVTTADLAAADPAAWKTLRAQLNERRERRVDRRRFRRNPEGYLNDLENRLNQSRLPA
jgi:hypothetical protein